MAAIPPFRNQRWLVKGWEETFNSQGKDYWDRYNHYLHKARIALFQHEQHVGNLHLNRTDSLWGKICSTNSFLSQILANACWAQRCRCWAFSTGGVSHNAALPPHGRQRNRRGWSDHRLIERKTTARTRLQKLLIISETEGFRESGLKNLHSESPENCFRDRKMGIRNWFYVSRFKFTICFSCWGERCNTVLLRSSRNDLV